MNAPPLALVLAALAGSPHTASPATFAGTYAGSLWSSGRDTPSTTTLEAASGLLTGRYSFVDVDGGTTLGKLDACRIEALAVTCRWQDSYGAGLLRMTFDASHCSFRGKWSTGGAAQDRDYWNGSKACAPVAEADGRQKS